MRERERGRLNGCRYIYSDRDRESLIASARGVDESFAWFIAYGIVSRIFIGCTLNMCAGLRNERNCARGAHASVYIVASSSERASYFVLIEY